MKAMLIGAIVSVVFSAHAQDAGTQPAGQKPSASVEGRVICSDGGAPAREATVRLRLLANLLPKEAGARDVKARNPPDEVTDFNGNYRFPAVAQGIYVVSVDLAGYTDDFGIARDILDHFNVDEQKAILATFPQVTVSASGSVRQDVVIHRGGSISGHVTIDSGGIPGKTTSIEPILVSTSLFGNTAEKDRQFGAPGINSWVVMDDRGFYRIAGLPQGKYKLKVQVTEHFDKQESFGSGSLYVYAPEALKNSDAQVIDVTEGEELTDIDINIPTRLLHSISGTITQGGEPVAKAHVSLRIGGESCNCGATTNADGEYRIDLLPSGTYTVEANAPSRRVPGGGPRPRSGRITVQLGDNDAASANIDLAVPTH